MATTAKRKRGSTKKRTGRIAGNKGTYRIALLDHEGNPTGNNWDFPSVTHVLDNVVAKPRLLYWYYKKAVAGASEVIGRYGAKTPSDPESLHQLMRQHGLTPWAYRDERAGVGKGVHDDIEKIVVGKDVTPTVDNEGFQNWWAARGLSPADIIATEVPLVSFKHRYAGTVDLVYRDPESGKVVLTDIKTGKYIHWTHLAQGQAYRMAWEEENDEPIDKVSVLHVRPVAELNNGWEEKVSEAVTPETWLSILNIYHSLPSNWKPEDISFEEEG